MRLFLWCTSVLLLLPLALSGMLLFGGSLEMFPTEEQLDKARLCYGAAFAFFALLELSACAALSALERRRRQRPGDGDSRPVRG